MVSRQGRSFPTADHENAEQNPEPVVVLLEVGVHVRRRRVHATSSTSLALTAFIAAFGPTIDPQAP